MNETKQRMGARQGRIQFQRLGGRSTYFRQRLHWGEQQVGREVPGVGQTLVGRSVGRIDRDGLVKGLDGFYRFSTAKRVKVILSFEVEFEGGGIDRTSGGKALLVLRRELYLNAIGDSASHTALQRKDVLGIALIAFRPDVAVGCGADQLCGYANATAGALHGTHNDALNVQFASDIRNVFLRVLV